MIKKLSLLLAFGAGYVLGARAGRERYEQIVAKAQGFWHNPHVQNTADEAQRIVKDKAADVVNAVHSDSPEKTSL